MAGSIKGITIELDGDTSKLGKALSDVDKKSRDLQSELKQVEKALKFSPGNTELIAQQQKLLGEQVQTTTTRLNRLKSAQQQVQQQFESGKIGADQYRAFQREIIQTESKLDGFKKKLASIDDTKAGDNVKQDLQQVEKSADDAQGAVSELGSAIAGLAAGGGIAKVVETAFDQSSLQTKINIAFDVPESSKKSVKDAIKSIEAYGIDGVDALEGVRRQWTLNKTASDQANSAIVKGAAVIATAYSGIDFQELIQETNEVAGALKISNQDALGLMNTLLKAGFPPEQIDIISEYGTQLQLAGFNAQQIQAIFAAGIDTNTWNIDNLIDGIKEGRIRLAEFGQAIPKALKPLLDQAGISQTQFQNWGKAVAKGGADGQKAMGEVAKAIDDVDNKTLKNSLGVAVLGTMYEDQGQNILDTLINASGKTVDLKSNTDQLNSSVAKMDSDPAVKFAQAITDLKTALTPLLQEVTNIINKISEWVSANPELAATITAIVTGIGILMGILLALAPIFTAIGAIAAAGLGAVSIAILAIIALIAGLIAIGIAIYQNWDSIWNSIKEVTITVMQAIGDGIAAAMMWLGEAILTGLTAISSFFTGVWEGIKTVTISAWTILVGFLVGVWNGIKATAIAAFNTLMSFLSGVWNGIKSTALSAWNTIKSFLVSAWNGIKSTATTVFNGIKSFLSNTWNSIKSTASNTWNAIKSAASNAWNGIKSTISNGISSAYNTITGYVGKFKTAGSSLLSALADGIKNGISKAVSAVSSGMATIRSYLPFSPAKVGPLSDLDKSGESFFPTFASKMNTGLKPMLAKVNAGLQEARSSIDTNQISAIRPSNSTTSVESPVNININFSGTVNMQNEQQIQELADLIDQAIARRTIINNRAGGVRVYGS